MADTEAIKQVIAQAVVEAAKAMALVISREGRKQSIHTEQKAASEGTMCKVGPSLRQPVFN